VIPSDTLPPGRFYRLAWVFYLILALAGLLWIGLAGAGPIPLALFADLRGWPLDLGLGVASGLLLVGIWRLARRFLLAARELNDQLARLLGGLSRADAVGLALLSGFAEELFFRGAVQGAWGWIVATVLFSLLHTTGAGRSSRVWTLFALVAGLLFAGLVLWRGNLLPAIVGHALVNAVNLTELAAQEPRDG
jgi:membrane protease YdiL (CAAX protease family)